jgi:hypothetical protein
MNQRIARFFRAGCLCLAATLPAAFGQSSEMLTADLPFAFQVNNKAFPAGKYRVTAGAGQAAVLLQSVDYKRAIYSLSNAIESGKTREIPTLVFRRYGDRYFLSQIWLPGSNSGRALRMSTSEKEFARSWATPATEAVAVARPPNVRR